RRHHERRAEIEVLDALELIDPARLDRTRTPELELRVEATEPQVRLTARERGGCRRVDTRRTVAATAPEQRAREAQDRALLAATDAGEDFRLLEALIEVRDFVAALEQVRDRSDAPPAHTERERRVLGVERNFDRDAIRRAFGAGAGLEARAHPRE